MKTKILKTTVALLLIALIFTAVSAAEPRPEYLYDSTVTVLPFSAPYSSLREIETHLEARRVFRSALDTLSAEERTDPRVLDALALLAEECIRFAGDSSPDTVRLDMLDSAMQYSVDFQRALRTGVTVRSDNKAEFTAQLDVELPDGTAFLHIDTPFASLRLDADRLDTNESVTLRALGVPIEIPDPTPMSVALRFWSVWAVLVVVLFTILVEPLRKRKATRWIVLCLCVILYGTNILLVLLTRTEEPPEGEGILVRMPAGMTAVLSIPITDDDQLDFTVFDARGEPVPCKINPVTHTFDARINGSGTYTLALSTVHFSDIKDKNTEMQQAIRVLTSRGLMEGGDERSFLPDRAITRAEFLSVVLRVINRLDESAESTFPDVLKSDWFYSVAASAQKERLISGFEDGTFRGNEPISKGQMVEIIANALSRIMNYTAPDEEEVNKILAAYRDGEDITDRRVRNAVALATAAGVVPRRVDGMFDGGGVMTRGEAAVMLYRLYNCIW